MIYFNNNKRFQKLPNGSLSSLEAKIELAVSKQIFEIAWPWDIGVVGDFGVLSGLEEIFSETLVAVS